MYYELSKRDKKIAKTCIDKGLEAEFREGLENVHAIIKKWHEGKFASNKEAYHQLFKAIDMKDNAIRRRYDGLTGSRWLITVIHLLSESYISESDIKDFSDEAKATISRQIHFLRRE
jgi:hypothetical protein